jgi:8-oxo-dGTP diphosphatase
VSLTPNITTLLVARRDDAVLLILRNKEPNRGLWSPPGGKLRDGEDPLTGAIREFAEETGLTAVDPSLAAVVWETDYARGEAWLMFVYRARATGEPATGMREGDAAWIELGSLASLPIPPADPAILEAALAEHGIAYLRVRMDAGRLESVQIHWERAYGPA